MYWWVAWNTYPAGTLGAGLQLDESAKHFIWNRAPGSMGCVGTGLEGVFSTRTAVAAMARAALGAASVRTNPASTTAPVPIKKDFANFIFFLRLCLALCGAC